MDSKSHHGLPKDPTDSSHQSSQASGSGSEPRSVVPLQEDSNDAMTFGVVPVIANHQETVISTRPPIDQGARLPTAHSQLAAELVNSQLHHFRVDGLVGGGGMGTVFRGVDTSLQRDVAIKVLTSEQSHDPENVKRFHNEAQSAARLDSPHIARVFHVGEDKGWHYIVFEYIDGDNVREMVHQRGPLALEECLRYVTQIARAIEHAEQRDVVHRDIKPSNILLTRDRQAKLVDMGLARLHQVHTEQDLTASGVTLGTFDYISPEQAKDPRNADVRSDIYSLGCTFFYMLTGQAPYPEGTYLQKLLSHSSDAPPDPRTLRPELTEETVSVLHRMMAKRPEKRYQRPDQLLAELLWLANRLGISVAERNERVVVAERPRLRNRWEYHLPWLVPTALLVAASVVGDLEWFESPERPPVFSEDSFVTPPPEIRTEVEITEYTPKEPTTSSASRQETRKLDAGGPDERKHMVSTQSENPYGSPEKSSRPSDRASRTPNTNLNGGNRLVNESIDSSAGDNHNDAVIRVGPEQRRASEHSTYSDLPPRVVVVQPGEHLHLEDNSKVVTTLEEALSFVENDGNVDVIELWFDGLRLQKPFTLPDIEVTLRAAPGFSPILHFRPTGRQRREMITMIGGKLRIEDVQFIMTIPEYAVESWALFHVTQARLLSLNRCVITVENTLNGRRPYHEDVSVVDVTLPPGRAFPSTDESTTEQTDITLRHSIVRGDTTMLRVSEAVPLRFAWYNGVFVTSLRLAEIRGSTITPSQGELIVLELEHVTAFMDRGLMRVTTTEDSPHLLTTDVRCANSILASNFVAPLFEHRGANTSVAYQGSMLFSGRQNFYQQVEIMWRVNAAVDRQSLEMDFQDWQDQWSWSELGDEYRPTLGQVSWRKLPDLAKSLHQHEASDYELNAGASNTVVESVNGERRHAGGILVELPQIYPANPLGNLGFDR